jgi:hypothetical protein
MSRSDRVIGIALGVFVGVVAVLLFVFIGSSGSIDAPSLDSKAAHTRQDDTGGAGGAGGAGGQEAKPAKDDGGKG